MAEMRFPEGFLWGAATSSHQVEGGNHNDWTAWEQANAERLAGEAKNRQWPDFILKNYPTPLQPENYLSGRATDHYHRFHEDFDIAKRLGHTAHRFSIEWSRIEPEEGKFNEAEIEHYRKVISALRELGMEPFVTLWHWTLPLWVRGQGGWENKKTVADFALYVERVVSEFKDSVQFWMPLNEPSSYTGVAYVVGIFPPNVRSFRRANRVFRNLVLANRRAYEVIHRIALQAKVGVGNYLVYHTPYRNYPWNRVAVALFDYFRNWRFLNALNTSQDFIDVQYYHHDAINFKFGRGRWGPFESRNENKWVSEFGWEIYPEGIYHLLKRVARYGKPIYITENGLADSRDSERAQFIREHLRSLARAMAEGADVRGYFYWSLLDNFEWASGFWPRFGLVEVDYKTLERKIRPSAWEYQKIIEANAVTVAS